MSSSAAFLASLMMLSMVNPLFFGTVFIFGSTGEVSELGFGDDDVVVSVSVGEIMARL